MRCFFSYKDIPHIDLYHEVVTKLPHYGFLIYAVLLPYFSPARRDECLFLADNIKQSGCKVSGGEVAATAILYVLFFGSLTRRRKRTIGSGHLRNRIRTGGRPTKQGLRLRLHYNCDVSHAYPLATLDWENTKDMESPSACPLGYSSYPNGRMNQPMQTFHAFPPRVHCIPWSNPTMVHSWSSMSFYVP